MAYLPIDEDQEEQQRQTQPGAAPSGPITSSAGVSGAVSGGAPGQAPTAGKYVNFQQYINANKGATDSMVNGLAGRVDKPGQAAETGLANAQSQFDKDVKAGSLTYGQQLTSTPRTPGPALATPAPSEVYRRPTATAAAAPRPPSQARVPRGTQPGTIKPSGLATAAPTVQTTEQTTPQVSMLATPTQSNVAAAPNYKAQYLAARSGRPAPDYASLSQRTYAGPGGLGEMEGYNDAKKQAERAQERARALAGPGGIEASIASAYGGQGARTGGQSRLDAGLAGAVGGSRFADLRQKYAGLMGKFSAAEGAAGDQAAAAAAGTASAAGRYGIDAGMYEHALGEVEKERQAEEDRRAAEAQAGRDQWTNASKGLWWSGGEGGSAGFDHRPAWDEFKGLGRGLFQQFQEWGITEAEYNSMSDDQVRALLEAAQAEATKGASGGRNVERAVKSYRDTRASAPGAKKGGG